MAPACSSDSGTGPGQDVTGDTGSDAAVDSGAGDLDAWAEELPDLAPDLHAQDTGADAEVEAEVEGPTSAPPTAGIVQPKDESVFTPGKTVTFLALGKDDVDPPETLAVAFSSNLDGPLHDSTLDKDGYCEFKTASLTVGLHTISLTITDSHGNVSPASIHVRINNPPTTPKIAIEPKNPGTLDDLTAIITGEPSDKEGDPVTLSIEWFVNGDKIDAATNETLTEGWFAKGDSVTVVLKSFDGFSWGDVSQDKVWVGNTPPSMEVVGITPLVGTAQSEFICLPGPAIDPDGDEVTLDFTWTVNSVEILGNPTDNLPPDVTAKGDNVRCSVTPGDGEAWGEAVLSPVATVANSPPGGLVVSLDPPAGDKTTLFTCNASGVTDPDDDPLEVSIFWFANDALLPGAKTPEFLPETLSKGTEIHCAVTVGDGTELLPPALSQTVVLANAPPTLNSVAVGPAGATTEDALVCTPEAFDPDMDDLQLTFSWTIDGKAVAGESGPTLPAGTAKRDQVVSCAASASDGTVSTLTVEAAATITIANALPTLDAAVIEPATGGELTIFYCKSVGWKDADGDLFEIQYEWLVNGNPKDKITAGAIDGDDFSKGDSVVCRITPRNGADTGTPVLSPPVTIANTPPEISAVDIDPLIGPPGTEFECTPSGWFDPDSDPEVYAYAWFVNGQPVPAAASETFDSTGVAGSSKVRCEVTPFDGQDEGVSLASVEVTVQ
jgi:hypothetical protein